jgi:hypothetical protein
MESSTVLAFRIFVMLSCLIIVPLAAIFGSAFPDVVKTVLVDRIVAWSTGKPVESSGAASQPDEFREVTPGPAAMAIGDRRENWQAPRWGAPESDTASWQTPGGGASGVVPLGGTAPREGFNQSASFSVPADSHTVYPPVHRVPATAGDQQRAVGAEQRTLATAPAGSLAAHAAPDNSTYPLAQSDRFREMERKLRAAGATYYLLETWGNDGQLYRFHCRMAVGNDPNQTRHFEATDSDALGAMSRVVEQVESWRGGP